MGFSSRRRRSSRKLRFSFAPYLPPWLSATIVNCDALTLNGRQLFVRPLLSVAITLYAKVPVG
jgi:hypothetical protein